MGKTGTTNDFRDALFVGSTYGVEGITIAVRIGFDDNRSLGPKETGGRVALPVFKEIMLKVYREKLTGPVPKFPARLEQSISAYLEGDSPDGEDLLRLGISAIRAFDPWPGRSSGAKGEWLQGFLLPQIPDLSENSICCATGR
jgi:membrane peptidoglycan carboxypeptidase